jgi:hypothetical protein
VYSSLIGAQAGGSSIPEVVAIKTATEETGVAVPVTRVTEGIAPEREAAVAPEVVVGAHADALPRASTKVVMREPEIQDAAQICLAPMDEATSTSRGGLEPDCHGSEPRFNAPCGAVDEGT